MPSIPPSASSAPFGRYVIRERIARGGMGEVFRAVAVGVDGFEKHVVIKRLLPKFSGRSDLAQLFATEAKLMTRLVHPNIVQVIDFGRGENDDCFLVMELVPGVDLGRLAQWHERAKTRIPVSIATYVVSQVLRGLSYAHGTFSADGKRLVHRDISPGNVLLSTFGEVKVADFGVALVAAPRKDGSTSEPKIVVGKPGYIAPEQFRHNTVDERADLYSLGALFFEVLTGGLPVMDGGRDAAEQHLSKESVALLNQAAPAPLCEVVVRALAALPDHRFPDARSMSQALGALVASGQPIATADDLAELVTRCSAETPVRAVPVVVLGASSPEPPLSPDAMTGTELTRVHAGEPGRFTVQMTKSATPFPPVMTNLDGGSGETGNDEADPALVPDRETAPSGGLELGATSLGNETNHEVSTRADAPPSSTPTPTEKPQISREKPTSRRVQLALFAALVAATSVGILLVAQFAARARSVSLLPSSAAPAVRDDSEPVLLAFSAIPVASDPNAVAAAPLESAAPSTPLSKDPAGGHVGRQKRMTTPTSPPTEPEAQGAEPVQEGPPHSVAECRGHVHVYANHGWILEGGPGTVQAPGRYDWPCGRYAVAAKSRIDGREVRHVNLMVRSNSTSVVDLR